MPSPRCEERPRPPVRYVDLEQFIRALPADYHWCKLLNCSGSDGVLEQLHHLAHGGDECAVRPICCDALLGVARELPTLPEDLVATPYGMWVVMLLLTKVWRNHPDDDRELEPALRASWAGAVRATMVAHSEEKRRRKLVQAEKERQDQLRSAARRRRQPKA